jgi:hypothetical protein
VTIEVAKQYSSPVGEPEQLWGAASGRHSAAA